MYAKSVLYCALMACCIRESLTKGLHATLQISTHNEQSSNKTGPYNDPRLRGVFDDFMHAGEPHRASNSDSAAERIEQLQARLAEARSALHSSASLHERRKRELQACAVVCAGGLQRVLAAGPEEAVQQAEATLHGMQLLQRPKKRHHHGSSHNQQQQQQHASAEGRKSPQPQRH
jgi:hypothetical protein